MFTGSPYLHFTDLAFCSEHPEMCVPILYVGLMDVQFELQGGLVALQALKNHPDVFVADTTPIQVIHEISILQPNVVNNLQTIESPTLMVDTSNVTWP